MAIPGFGEQVAKVSGLNQSWSDESCSLLQKADLPGKQGNVLLIKHPELSWPDGNCLERNQQSFDRAIHLNLGAGTERFSGLSCRSQELPFVEASFRLVVLWHVLGTGEEAELAEACRVLAAGGDLLILGLQQRKFMTDAGGQGTSLPVLQRRRVLHNLQDAGMNLVTAMGTGLPMCKHWVVQQAGLTGMLLPLSRLLLLQARHGNPAMPSPLRLDGFRAGIAPTT